jgi:hypothetical protein
MDPKRIRIKRDVTEGAEKPAAIVEPIDPFERASRFAPMYDLRFVCGHRMARTDTAAWLVFV